MELTGGRLWHVARHKLSENRFDLFRFFFFWSFLYLTEEKFEVRKHQIRRFFTQTLPDSENMESDSLKTKFLFGLKSHWGNSGAVRLFPHVEVWYNTTTTLAVTDIQCVCFTSRLCTGPYDQTLHISLCDSFIAPLVPVSLLYIMNLKKHLKSATADPLCSFHLLVALTFLWNKWNLHVLFDCLILSVF